MPIIYGAYGSPFVRKVCVFLAEKNVSYDLEPVIPLNVSPDYRKIHPMGKIPAFRDGDKIIPDSSVICAYLEKTHPTPPLYPSDPYEYARALWYEEYADTALIQVIGGKIFFPKIIAPMFMNKPMDEAAVKKAVEEDVPPLFNYLEGELREGKPLVGDRFSIADISVASHLGTFLLSGYTIDEKRWPKLAEYFRGIYSRPSFKNLTENEKKTFGL